MPMPTSSIGECVPEVTTPPLTIGIPWRGTAFSSLTKDASYGEVESVKAVSDVIAPLSGEVLEVNQKVVDEPETVNEDPYGGGWLVRIRVADPSEADGLMDAAAYQAHLATL